MTEALRRYVGIVAALGLLTIALVLVLLLRQGPAVGAPLRMAVLTAVSLASVLMPLRFYRKGGSQGFHFEGSVLVAGLLILNPLWVPVLMTVASLVGHGYRTRNALKAAFNTGQAALQTSAGALVFVLVTVPGDPATAPRAMVAAILASVVYEALSVVAMGELFHRLDGTPRRKAASEVASLAVVTFAGNAAYGIVLATVLEASVLVAVISGALMFGLYAGYRGYATAVSDHRRAEALNDMTHMLINMPSNEAGLSDFLKHVMETFGGTEGTLVLTTPSGVRTWDVSPDGTSVTAERELPRLGVLAEAATHERGMVATARRTGSAEVIAAPVRKSDGPVGAISVAERRGFEPWDQSDATLLSAIANELAVALDNVDLFQQVEEERARLEAETTKLNNILGAATDGIVSVLADGTIDSWNPGIARITGVEAEDAIGRPWHAVLRLKDGAGRDVAPSGDLALILDADEVGASVAFQVLRVDGEWRRLQCTASPVLEPGGGRRGTVMVARDVTAEHEVKELKSDFIATVSHELRTPLTPLKGFLTTLQNAGATLTADQRETVFRSMGAQLSRLEALIADLLTVAELDRGQQDLHTGPVQLSQLVPHAVDGEAGPQRDRCTVEVDVEDVVAQADAVAIVRIVRSLVSNALKHADGPVRVRVDGDHEWARVAVSDDGPGIPRWNQQRIFGHFDRLGNHLHRTQGPGLGLTIARSLAHRMGGDIALESELGEGTTFTLRLPVARPRLVTQPAVSRGSGV